MFKLKICLIIAALCDAKTGSIAVAAHGNQLPYIDILPEESKDINHKIDKLFLDVTNISPRWANLKFYKTHIYKDQIVMFYNTVLSIDDVISCGFNWHRGIDNIDCYGLNPRSILHV